MINAFLNDIARPSNFPTVLLDLEIIYNLSLHLGSFPFVVEPAQSLTYEIFATGLIVLSDRLTRSLHQLHEVLKMTIIRDSFFKPSLF
jgi:hypothetical protein